jgi:hypothetical protein
LGAVLEVPTAGEGPPVSAVEVEWEHATTEVSPRRRDREPRVEAMRVFLGVEDR